MDQSTSYLSLRYERGKPSRSPHEIGVDEALPSSSLVSVILGPRETWNQVSAFATQVLKKKLNLGWNRQMQNYSVAYSTPVYHQHPGGRRRTDSKSKVKPEKFNSSVEGNKIILNLCSRISTSTTNRSPC